MTCALVFREVLECPKCGVIYRSRERWYGNKNMEDIVSVEVRHVWPDVSILYKVGKFCKAFMFLNIFKKQNFS